MCTSNAMRLQGTEHPVYSWLVSKVHKARKPKKAKYRLTHIRDWRKYRNDMTLKQLEERMEKAPGEPLISDVSIGRIERGLQPYTQPILEALAVALDCSVWELLEVNPFKEGEVVDLFAEVRRLRGEQDPKKIKQAIKHIQAIA